VYPISGDLRSRTQEKSTTAEPSLSSDSPSIRVARALEAPNSRRRATTATGSVAERMMPMSQQTQNDLQQTTRVSVGTGHCRRREEGRALWEL
jgi:hypothetical protein